MDSKNMIIWAIDPFDKETVPDQATIQKFVSWLQSSNLELQPVHILTVPKHETTAYMGLRSKILRIRIEYLNAIWLHRSRRFVMDKGNEERTNSSKISEQEAHCPLRAPF
jgi:hypothetical protein